MSCICNGLFSACRDIYMLQPFTWHPPPKHHAKRVFELRSSMLLLNDLKERKLNYSNDSYEW